MTTISMDENGLTTSTLAEVIEDGAARLKAKRGNHIRVDDPDGVYGRLNHMNAEMRHHVIEQISALVSALLPSTTTGEIAKEIVKFNGISINESEYSLVTLLCTANASGATIPIGRVVATDGGDEFETLAELVLTASASDSVSARSVTKGSFDVEANTITTIVSDAYGWESVTNPLAASGGRATETIPALRKRRKEAAAGVGLHSPSAIKKAIDDIDGVTESLLDINYNSYTSSTGVPSGHIRAIVKGGSNQDIADSLFGVGGGAGSVAAGIGTWGDVDVVATDPETSQTETISFDRSTDVPIYIDVVTSKIPGQYPGNGNELIRGYTIDFFNGVLEVNDVTVEKFGLGDDVTSSRLYTPANACPGHTITQINISRSASPTSEATLPMALNEIAVTDVAKITINGQ